MTQYHYLRKIMSQNIVFRPNIQTPKEGYLYRSQILTSFRRSLTRCCQELLPQPYCCNTSIDLPGNREYHIDRIGYRVILKRFYGVKRQLKSNIRKVTVHLHWVLRISSNAYWVSSDTASPRQWPCLSEEKNRVKKYCSESKLWKDKCLPSG